MRKIGVAALGVVGGVLLAIIIQDVLARSFVDSGTVPVGLGLVISLIMPVLAVLGAVVAIVLHNRNTKRGSDHH